MLKECKKCCVIYLTSFDEYIELMNGYDAFKSNSSPRELHTPFAVLQTMIGESHIGKFAWPDSRFFFFLPFFFFEKEIFF